ncbi:MAG: nucleotidyltransferase domain-containing protein [Bacteroidales bacterium]|nr:nucleotidyltransferase domain-containing protein [Bacteroidales bacterium]
MDKKISEIVKKFKLYLGNMGVKVDRMILFGSYAEGTNREGSDIDIVVISEDFNNMDILRRLETIGLALARAKIMEPVEALGYTEKEFSAKGSGTFLGEEVKEKGIEVR